MLGLMSDFPLLLHRIIDHAAKFHGERKVISRSVEGPIHETNYAQIRARSLKVAQRLEKDGIKLGDRVATLAWNTWRHLECWYGILGLGAIYHTVNPRLFPDQISWIVNHAGDRMMFLDLTFVPLMEKLADKLPSIEKYIVLTDGANMPKTTLKNAVAYEDWIAEVDGDFEWRQFDENTAAGMCYTSGTTGDPKGVVYHHRGAHLNAVSNILNWGMPHHAIYLWTLPMFHCNGWCFTWAVTAAGATHLCLRKADPALLWSHLRDAGVTQFNAAPTILIMLAWHQDAQPLTRTVNVATGGAPPTPALLARMAELNMNMTHLYGLTETFGPAVICEWRKDWDQWPAAQQAQIKARQGVGNVISESLRVVDSLGTDVAKDGAALGEIALRGNNVMLGYYRDQEATQKASPDGWFRTGDLAVMHADGYLEIKDRAKDIIISGGENIASLEVERTLSAHPAVLEAAVVAAPDEKWGEVPVAFVTLKPGQALDAATLIAYTRDHMAHFKAPKRVVFGELPKNATGKIQKFILRERARALRT